MYLRTKYHSPVAAATATATATALILLLSPSDSLARRLQVGDDTAEIENSISSLDPLCTSMVDGSRSFAANLLPELSPDPYDGTSSAISPTSIRQAFYMVGQGAGPSDALEMQKALRTCSDESFANLAGPVMNLTSAPGGAESDSDDNFRLTIANAVYVDQTFPINPEYTDSLKEHWKAEATSVDFRTPSGASEAKDQINAFVADKTEGIIDPLLLEPPSTNTALYLVNALYFKARWRKSFDEAYPQKFVSDENAKWANMMTETQYVPYVDGGTYTAISLPYREMGYEMLLIRPNGCSTPSGMKSDLTNLISAEGCLDATLADALAKAADMSPTRVKVTIPRFRVQWRSEGRSLITALEALGMQKVFSPTEADLSGISNSSQLFVSSVAHVADVRVAEDGTEAAAATGIGISLTSIPIDPPDEFRADVPFVYAIYHKPSQEVLFAGWVNEDALEITGDVEDEDWLLPAERAVNACQGEGPKCPGDVGFASQPKEPASQIGRNFVCPSINDACMNEKNYAVCQNLVQEGCKEILTMESCPLQFACSDVPVSVCPDKEPEAWSSCSPGEEGVSCNIGETYGGDPYCWKNCEGGVWSHLCAGGGDAGVSDTNGTTSTEEINEDGASSAASDLSYSCPTVTHFGSLVLVGHFFALLLF